MGFLPAPSCRYQTSRQSYFQLVSVSVFQSRIIAYYWSYSGKVQFPKRRRLNCCGEFLPASRHVTFLSANQQRRGTVEPSSYIF